MKGCQLFGTSPLFGVSIKREQQLYTSVKNICDVGMVVPKIKGTRL